MREVLIIDSNQESALKLARFLENPDASIAGDVDAFVDCCIRCEIRSVGRYAPVVVGKVDEGLKKIKSKDRKVVLINAASLEMNGLDALKKIKEKHSGVIVIMIGADSDTALEAMLLGASDVASKTSDMEGIHRMLGEAFCRLYIRRAKIFTTATEEASKNRSRLVGESEPMFEVKKKIGLVAPSTISVLLEGETGTGKEVVAQLIHEKSGRPQSEFKAIDCGAMNQELLDSELFGHEPGAYTGASQEEGRLGAFRSAEGGTLFLDEIGNTTAEFQKRLLRVLETQEVKPMGRDGTHEVDVRIIAATNQNLKQMVKEGTFREDLFSRLKGRGIYLPPLRERKEDIKLLVSHFLKHAPRISEPAMKLLEDYYWPGNVRELKKCVESAARSSQGETILPKDLPQEIRMYRGDEGSEGDVQERQSSETPKRPMYKNLFDVSVAVFCQFISKAENITETDIIKGSKALAPHAHRRVTDAERAIHKWERARKDGRIAPDDLRTNIADVVTEAVIRLSELRYSSDSRRAAAKPFSIVGKTLEGSLIAVLNEVVEEYGNDRKKAAEMLKMHPKTLDGWLDPERTRKRETSTDSCTREHFPDKEVESLLTKSVDNFVMEQFSRAEWREKSPNERIRIVHLALRTVSGRLAEDHGCIYFGGMTFKQIKKQIYRRAAYLYSDEATAAEALGVDVRTFRKHWPLLGSEADFPDHYTLF